ncbi:TraG family conjugative transposon ATPase [Pedobacter xixiisoli]|uniref:Bacteroides conjugation system ATPase, TraG family n=1 Tax=Pedobacter xixiisoli TaxID=1476464 RepID=A0A286A780_9SPHI|nr:TraG family conjugative transposon ATPase [Pedobacter xixiisoli]SOD17681.1 Bacteroides conjugation system ATPase, TraG family [Pedobacter xixiisoli]
MEKVIDELYPIMDVEHDCILSKKGDMTIVYRADLPEVFSLSDTEYESVHQALVKAIKVLPKHSILCKQDWFVEAKYEADFSKEDASFLSRSSERFFNERPYLDHSCYIMLTKLPKGRKFTTSLFSNLLRRTIVPEETLDSKILQEFLDSCGQFKRILEDSGFVHLTRMGNEDLMSQATKVGLLEKYLCLNERNTDLLVGDISFDESLRVGDKYCQLYTLGDIESLPGKCSSRINYEKYSSDRTKFSIGFASPLGQLLPCNHIYSQYIFIEDAAKTMKQLESKKLRLQSLSAYSRENAIARDAVNDFLNEAIIQQRLPVKAHFNVLAWTDGKDGLKDLRNQVTSALTQMDAAAKLETVGAPQIFWAGIPGNAGDFPINDTFDTFAEQATCFLNLETGSRSSQSPFGIRLGDRLTGKPLHVDISDEPMKKGIITNRNKFILGPSGSGKSFLTNHFQRSYHEQETHAVIVDVGHSYKGLCELLNGYYFTYSEDNPIRFNPFYLGEEDLLDTEKKESIKTMLLALWKKDDEKFTRAEYVALSNAITGFFDFLEQHPEVFPCFDSFYEFLKDHYIGVLQAENVKDRDFDINNFMYVLRPYYKGGEFDYLLNATENLDLLHERFIVFELDNIKDHPILFPVVTIIIMQVFISKMRILKGIRKTILIEEAWKALMKEGFAEYIKYLFKTVRKFFGEAIVVTQDIEDIISSPIVKQAIINNSDCKILLDQSKYQNKFELIQELLALTDKQKAMVLSVNKANDPTKTYKEVFIGLGGTHSAVYRIEVSLEEYLAYTTEQTEKVTLMEYAERFGGDIRKGIMAMADDLRIRA